MSLLEQTLGKLETTTERTVDVLINNSSNTHECQCACNEALIGFMKTIATEIDKLSPEMQMYVRIFATPVTMLVLQVYRRITGSAKHAHALRNPMATMMSAFGKELRIAKVYITRTTSTFEKVETAKDLQCVNTIKLYAGVAPVNVLEFARWLLSDNKGLSIMKIAKLVYCVYLSVGMPYAVGNICWSNRTSVNGALRKWASAVRSLAIDPKYSLAFWIKYVYLVEKKYCFFLF